MDDGAEVVWKGLKVLIRGICEFPDTVMDVFEWLGRKALRHALQAKQEVTCWAAILVGLCSTVLICMVGLLIDVAL